MARIGGLTSFDRAGPANDYDTVSNVGTGTELTRPFRSIRIVTAGAVTLRNSDGSDVSFGTLEVGYHPLGGNYITAAPADAVLLY
jgi:hypothetical protein